MSAQSERQKTALVTGASSGIGFAVSKELASKGFKVYAAARRLEPMEPLKEFGVIPVQLDVSSSQSIQSLKELLENELKDSKLDVLYNNAGQSCTLPAIDVTDEQVQQAFAVNVFGPISLTRELVHLIINAKGTVLFTGSLAGYVPFPFSSIYCATKAAIHQYARVLHLELKGFGVRVINVVTGGVHTNIADTRPLPKGSLFDIPEGRECLANRQTMAKNNLPMSPEVYATKVVKDILSSCDPIDVYRGSFASVMVTLRALVPSRLAEYLLCLKFGLFKVFKALNLKQKNTQGGVELHLE